MALNRLQRFLGKEEQPEIFLPRSVRPMEVSAKDRLKASTGAGAAALCLGIMAVVGSLGDTHAGADRGINIAPEPVKVAKVKHLKQAQDNVAFIKSMCESKTPPTIKRCVKPG